MQTITVTLNSAKNSPPIELGHQGENLATTIQFDVTAWAEAYGDGSVVLLNQRKNETPYPVVVEKEDNIVTWNVTNVDTGIAGTGWCELQYYVGNVLAKSDKWRTITKEALGESGDVPEPWEGFLDEVASLTARSETAATNAAQSAEAAAGSESTVEAYKDAAETAAANAAAAQALANQYAVAAALARQAAETAATAAASAKTSAEAAKASAIASAQAAAADKLAAAASAAAAQAAEQAALASQTAAAASAAAAAGSEQSVADNAAAAIAARDAAQRAQEAAQASQTAAASSAATAATSATAAQNAASAAAQSAQAAVASATNASGSATAAESWAVGGTGTRTGEDTDNAEYYATQAGDANTDVQEARTDIRDSIDGVAQEDTAQQTLAILTQIADTLDGMGLVIYVATLPQIGVANVTYITPDGIFRYEDDEFVQIGGSSGDLNGFSLSLGDNGGVVLSYTDPSDETITGSATLPADDTAQSILANITSIADSVEQIAGGGT